VTHPLTVTALGDLEVTMQRRFDAPRELVFDAWTKPELLRQWLGVFGGWAMPICEIDLRVGGRYRYVWRNEEGAEMGVGGTYENVVRPHRIVCRERFDEPWYAGEALVTNALEEVDGGTLCILTMHYESKEARDMVLASPMESGVAAGFLALDRLLANGPSTQPIKKGQS